jgi:tetratricopeptide (TPR) repeat protein
MPLERAIRERRFAYGADCESRLMKQPPGTISLEAIPAPIADLFRRAFLSATAAERPNPQEWIVPLESLAKSLKRCALHSGHHYFGELSECPWCRIEMEARIRLFNFPRTGRGQERAHFKLDDVWREISSISPPPSPPPIRAVGSPEPSPLGLKAMRERTEDLILAIVFAVIAGFIIGLTTSSVLLLILAGTGVVKIARTKGLLSFQFRNSKFLSPIAEKIQTGMHEADENVRELEQKWKEEATDERFINKFIELQNRKETYERIPQIRQLRLHNLDAQGNGVTHRARIAVEKEIDELRHRLEHELSSGAFYLNRVKSQIEDSRQRLLPSLLNEKQTFAQAEKDWEVATRQNGRKLVILILIVAFFVGASLRQKRDDRPHSPISAETREPERIDPPPEEPVTIDEPEREKRAYPRGTSKQAIALYERGVRLVRAKEYVEAVEVLEQAVKLDSRIGEAWQQLGFAYYRLGNFEKSLYASNRALLIKEGFGPHYNIGLVHIAQENWLMAGEAMSNAVKYCSTSTADESCAFAHKYLDRPIPELGKAQ